MRHNFAAGASSIGLQGKRMHSDALAAGKLKLTPLALAGARFDDS